MLLIYAIFLVGYNGAISRRRYSNSCTAFRRILMGSTSYCTKGMYTYIYVHCTLIYQCLIDQAKTVRTRVINALDL